MSITIILFLLAAGVFTGFMAGLLGIGGGIIIVPFLTTLFTIQTLVPAHYMVHIAIATAMATILFTSLSSTVAHHKKGGVIWPIVLKMAPGIIIGGLLSGTMIFQWFSTGWLAFIFSIFIFYSAYNMIRNKKPKASRQLPGILGLSTVGVVIGLLSGLVGAGGGFLSVPYMVWSNVSVKKAVATSAAIGFPIAIANSAGYIYSGLSTLGVHQGLFGYIYWPALLVISSMTILFAPLGARYAHIIPVEKLRRIFACLLFLIAAFMLHKSLVAFGYL